MSKLVCHFGKFTKNNVFGLQKHNQRENKNYSNENIDLEKSVLNYDIQNSNKVNYLDTVNKIIEENRTNSKKAVRKDAVVFVDTVISSDNLFFNKLSKQETEKFFKESYNYLSNKVGDKNIISSVVHMDEYTPHMHFNFVPINSDGSLSAKKMINRNFLRSVQDEFPKYLQSKGFDIERGMENSLKKHLEPIEYKKSKIKDDMLKINKQQDDIIGQLETLRDKADKLYKVNEHLDSRIGHIDSIKPKKAFLSDKLTISKAEYEILVGLAKKGESKLIQNIYLSNEVVNLSSEVTKLQEKLNEKSVSDRLREQKLKNYDNILKENRKLENSFRNLEKALNNLDLIDIVNKEIHKIKYKEKSR